MADRMEWLLEQLVMARAERDMDALREMERQ